MATSPQKILIIFPEGNLSYSPTTLNIIEGLHIGYEISIIATKVDNMPSEKNYSIEYFNDLSPSASFLHRAIKKVRGSIKAAGNNFSTHQEVSRFNQIKAAVIRIQPDFILAVDLFALECCRLLNKSCLFLSLEIPGSIQYPLALAHTGIKGVIIQSKERFNHLFTSFRPKLFLLPNSPVFSIPEKMPVLSDRLIYNGYIWSAFGPQFCLNFITKYSGYSLTLKGALAGENMTGIYYPHLQDCKSVSIDSAYLSEGELKVFLSSFSIGFCFYNFEHPHIKKNEFNYLTAPSGKLFNYISCGLPVICSRIPGFTFIEENNAGILIDDYSPDSIKAAIEKITSDYTFYSSNALRVAEENCFSKHFRPVIDFLSQID